MAEGLVDIVVRRLAGGEVTVPVAADVSLRVLRDQIAVAADVGRFGFTLCLESGARVECAQDDRVLETLGLQSGTVLLMMTDSARDYSRIEGPERVIKTTRFPAGVLVGSNGDLFVTHFYGDLSIYDSEYNLKGETRKLPFQMPRQLVFAPTGEIVVVFATAVAVFDPTDYRMIRKLGDDLRLSQGRGLAMLDDKVYVTDAVQHCIHVLSFSSGALLRTVTPCGRSASLSVPVVEPCGLAIIDDKLAVADRGNDRILLLDPDTLEEHSRLPEIGDVPDARLRSPNDVKMDSGGNVLVMDTGNQRLAVFRGGKFVTSVMQGFFKNTNSYSNIGCNDVTGAVAATNDDGHSITVLAPLFDAP